MVQEISIKKIDNILVILLAGLGDCVMASPALRALKNKFPDKEITILILAQNWELLQNCAYVNEIFVLEKVFSFKGVFKNFITIFKLRKGNFDVAINLYSLYSFWGAFKIFCMLFLIRPKKTIGRNTEGKGFFYDFKIEDSMNFKKHQVECMLDCLADLGIATQDKRLEVWYSQERELSVKELLSSQGIAETNLVIGINPGARRLTRRWPIEKFVILSKLITKYYNAKLVITGSIHEKNLAQIIKNEVGENVVVTSGLLGLSELILLIKLCRIYITNDTGPMHIANALGVPLIVLIGASSEENLPFMKDNVTLIKKDVDCRPCYKNNCKEFICFDDISPELVMESVEKELKKY
ncbi:MAG: glycosyltransferase family 9 protein [Candidatus Omnitrophota bacterium]|nr:glycosyltransferase family 9 protein [Candidatus Omnitrophota bacterium]